VTNRVPLALIRLIKPPALESGRGDALKVREYRHLRLEETSVAELLYHLLAPLDHHYLSVLKHLDTLVNVSIDRILGDGPQGVYERQHYQGSLYFL
jgi:hypothetical protein